VQNLLVNTTCRVKLFATSLLCITIQQSAPGLQITFKNVYLISPCICILGVWKVVRVIGLSVCLKHFYARKQQLLLSARLSHRNSVRPSVRLSVRPSRRWISQKQCKLGLPNLHHRMPGRR